MFNENGVRIDTLVVRHKRLHVGVEYIAPTIYVLTRHAYCVAPKAGSQPVPDARHQQREGRAQRVAAAVGDALLKGHTMLNDHCRDCLTVLMKVHT